MIQVNAQNNKFLLQKVQIFRQPVRTYDLLKFGRSATHLSTSVNFRFLCKSVWYIHVTHAITQFVNDVRILADAPDLPSGEPRQAHALNILHSTSMSCQLWPDPEEPDVTPGWIRRDPSVLSADHWRAASEYPSSPTSTKVVYTQIHYDQLTPRVLILTTPTIISIQILQL